MSTLDPHAPQDVQCVQRIVAALERTGTYLDPGVLKVGVSGAGEPLGVMALDVEGKAVVALYVRAADGQNPRRAWRVTASRIEVHEGPVPGETVTETAVSGRPRRW